MSISQEFLIPILQRLISIPTENPPGITKDIVDYIFSIFSSDKRFRKRIIINTKDGVELHNIVVEIGDGREKIVLCGHLDTVPAGSRKNWRFDPFSGTIENGKVYGRGSVDMKGGVASLIGVMFDFLDEKEFLEKYTLVFIGTADEEAGMSGAEAVEKEEIMKDAILLIIAEATNMDIGIAEKGVIWAKLKVFGKQAHGSMPEQGINAIEVAAELFPKLHEVLDPDITSDILGRSTLNIGTISGGTKINVVPNEVEIELDFRLIPEEDQDLVLKKLSNLETNTGRYEIEYFNILPALKTRITNFHDNLAQLTGHSNIGLSYGTDAAKLLVNNENIPFVIFGPGDSKILHQDNEFVPIDQVILVAKTIKDTLKKTFF